MSGRVLVLLMLVAGLVLAGCTPYHSSRTCEEISAANLRALVQETTSLEQAVTRVAETLHVPAEEVTVLRSRDNPNEGDVDWRAGGVHYTVIVKSSGVLCAGMIYESNPPSADEVITAGVVPVRIGRGWQVGVAFILLALPMRCLDRTIERRILEVERVERGQ